MAEAKPSGNVIRIHSQREALDYGDRWQAHARRVDALLLLAEAQRDASDLLLRIAEAELARLRKVVAESDQI